MANKLFEQLNGAMNNNANKGSSAKEMLASVMNSRNPSEAMKILAARNSGVANVINEINSSGKDAKTLFYEKAKAMGVDPNSILSKFR